MCVGSVKANDHVKSPFSCALQSPFLFFLQDSNPSVLAFQSVSDLSTKGGRACFPNPTITPLAWDTDRMFIDIYILDT